MGYLNKMLLPNEKVVYYSRLHWIIFLPVILLFILSIGFFIYGDFLVVGSVNVLMYVGCFFIILCIWFFLSYLIQYWGTKYCITNRRVILKKGFFQVQISENFINKIEDVRLNQGVLGRLLSYGTCIVIGTGGTSVVFRYLNNPLKFQRTIQSQISVVR